MFSTAIVAFFPGTLLAYRGKRINNNNQSEKERQRYKYDRSFKILSQCIADETEVLGYDGCGLSSGLKAYGSLFAFGFDESSKELYHYIKIKHLTNKIKKNSLEKINLILETHSRGFLSALSLAKKIEADDELRETINVYLNIRDPVPGNFNIVAAIDVTGSTVTQQFRDLSDCSCIKKVHITVLESGDPISPIDHSSPGYDVLIPNFSDQTELDIEYLPGTHMLSTENPCRFEYDESRHVYTAHPIINQLILYRSLQMYVETGVAIDYQNTMKCLLDTVEEIVLYREVEQLNERERRS
jgi:hypothetical protein